MSETTCYERNRDVILKIAKYYYENNKELLRKRAKKNKKKNRELPENKKDVKRQYKRIKLWYDVHW